MSEAKVYKARITQLLEQGHDHTVSNPDKPLDFDLAQLGEKWLELKQLLKDLSREGRRLTGGGSEQHPVYLSYSTTDKHTVSTGILFPSASNRRIGISRRDPKQSLLKEKGRTYVTKLSIPYRVFIKSKVKQQYFGHKSADNSFADTSFSEFSFDSSSLNSSRSYSPTTVQCQGPDVEYTGGNILKAVSERENDDKKHDNTNTHCASRSEVDHTYQQPEEEGNNNTNFSDVEEVKELEDIMAMVVESGRGSPKSTGKSGTRASPVPIEQCSPITSKRRRLNSDDDSASSIGSPSPRGSPVPMTGLPSFGAETLLAENLAMHTDDNTPKERKGVASIKYPVPEVMRGYGPSISPSPILSRYQDITPGTSPGHKTTMATPGEDLMNLTFEGIDSNVSSNLSTPANSPYPTLSRDFRKKYKKDELWAAIQSDYHYLMDDEIIETCKVSCTVTCPSWIRNL